MPLTITVQLSDREVACLKNDLMDIDEWVQKAVIGKVNNCKKRLIREWQPKMFADPNVTSIPGDESGFIDLVFTHPDYKDRDAREEITAAKDRARRSE